MERVWEDVPASRFMQRLLNGNLDRMINDPEKLLLKHMRYDNELLKRCKKYYGRILKERGLTLEQLIASAYGENWEMQEEKKET